MIISTAITNKCHIEFMFKLALCSLIFPSKPSPVSMLKKIPQSKLGVSEPDPSWFGNPPNIKSESWTNKNWLKSRFHFSFAEYDNHNNQNFGVLRVMNDDLVQPDRGFGSHPHRNVEICTYIIDGFLTHQDSIGTKETLTRGAIQFMTAGSGVVHSEHNLDKTKPLRFIQMWINTRKNNIKPNYGSSIGDEIARKNKWHHMVTDVDNSYADDDIPIKINQDANILVSEIDMDKSISYTLKPKRQAYLLCMEGQISISMNQQCITLEKHDAAEIYSTYGSNDDTTIDIKTVSTDNTYNASHVLMVEMAYTGEGRGDI